VKLVRTVTAVAFAALTASAPTFVPPADAAAGPPLRSVGPLAFGPGGVMYAAENA